MHEGGGRSSRSCPLASYVSKLQSDRRPRLYVVVKVGRRAAKDEPACHKEWVPVPAGCPHAPSPTPCPYDALPPLSPVPTTPAPCRPAHAHGVDKVSSMTRLTRTRIVEHSARRSRPLEWVKGACRSLPRRSAPRRLLDRSSGAADRSVFPRIQEGRSAPQALRPCRPAGRPGRSPLAHWGVVAQVGMPVPRAFAPLARPRAHRAAPVLRPRHAPHNQRLPLREQVRL